MRITFFGNVCKVLMITQLMFAYCQDLGGFVLLQRGDFNTPSVRFSGIEKTLMPVIT